MMSASFNPFAVLLDPAGILGTCAQSDALGALPLSAKRCADRQSPLVAGELAEHDAAVEGIYQKLIAKAAKASQPVVKPSKTRSKGARSAQTV